MEFIKFVEQIPNITIAKRIASTYVADYRRLDLNEIKSFLIKTEKQYTSYDNISARLDELKLDSNRTVRIIAPILLRDYLLDQDDFISPCKDFCNFFATFAHFSIKKDFQKSLKAFILNGCGSWI